MIAAMGMASCLSKSFRPPSDHKTRPEPRMGHNLGETNTGPPRICQRVSSQPGPGCLVTYSPTSAAVDPLQSRSDSGSVDFVSIPPRRPVESLAPMHSYKRVHDRPHGIILVVDDVDEAVPA